MKKNKFTKTSTKSLKRVTRSNLKDYIGGYRSILPVAVFALLLAIFVSINTRLVPNVSELPQTGEPASQLAFDAFTKNAQIFISSPEGTLFLTIFFISLVTFLIYIAKTGFPRRK